MSVAPMRAQATCARFTARQSNASAGAARTRARDPVEVRTVFLPSVAKNVRFVTGAPHPSDLR